MLTDRLLIADSTAHLSPLAVIGAPGEDKRRGVDPPNHGVVIGPRTVVREFATLHGGFSAPTRIGADAYIMAHCHVGHDSVLHDHVTLATGATLGGHTIVHEGANIGLRAVTHQHVTIGAYAMIGAGAVVLEDVPPFQTWAGVPAKRIGWNVVGMQRAGFSDGDIFQIVNGKNEDEIPDRANALIAQWDRDRGRRGKK